MQYTECPIGKPFLVSSPQKPLCHQPTHRPSLHPWREYGIAATGGCNTGETTVASIHARALPRPLEAERKERFPTAAAAAVAFLSFPGAGETDGWRRRCVRLEEEGTAEPEYPLLYKTYTISLLGIHYVHIQFTFCKKKQTMFFFFLVAKKAFEGEKSSSRCNLAEATEEQPGLAFSSSSVFLC